MSIIASVRGKTSVNLSSLGLRLFDSPEPAGRKITAGFTYLQRISKAASFDVWFPDALKREIEVRQSRGLPIGAESFPAQWAAVREFDLLQESGNHKIYDLDPTNMQRATLDLARGMRAGGYRVTVATVGRYQETGTGDELEILDRNLQERLAQMIQMLYLNEASDQANADNDAKLEAQEWDYRQELPYVGMVLGAGDLFCPMQTLTRRHKQARQFFNVLGTLPQSHIVHDTAIGLQLPELSGENQWNYIASPDETLAAFNRVLGDLFDAPTFHLRGYGDRLSESSDRFYRNASLALN
jgi:hypothetical protein